MEDGRKEQKKKRNEKRKERKELDVEELGCLEGFLEISKEGGKTNISRWKLWKREKMERVILF